MDIRSTTKARTTALARGLARPRALLGLPGRGQLQARDAPHVRGGRPGTSSASRPTSPTRATTAPTIVGEMPVIVVRDADGAINCLREPLRPSRRADRLRRRRQRPATTSSASTTPGATTSRATCAASPSRRASTAMGGMPDGLLQGGPRPAQAAHHDAVRPGVRHACRPTRRRSRSISASEVLGRIKRVLQPADPGDGPLRAGRCPTTGSSTSRTSRTPITRACCTPSSATFRITRLTQGGGVLVSPDGGNHASYTIAMRRRRQQHRLQGAGIRSEQDGSYRAGRSQPARLGRRVRRRHPAADPVGLPRLRPAADPQLPRGAPGRAARRRQDGAGAGPISASRTTRPR